MGHAVAQRVASRGRSELPIRYINTNIKKVKPILNEIQHAYA